MVDDKKWGDIERDLLYQVQQMHLDIVFTHWRFKHA